MIPTFNDHTHKNARDRVAETLVFDILSKFCRQLHDRSWLGGYREWGGGGEGGLWLIFVLKKPILLVGGGGGEDVPCVPPTLDPPLHLKQKGGVSCPP